MKKILVVEDQEINRLVLRQILEHAYEVLEAENGRQALDVLMEYKEDISLILLDIQMPVMDGYTFLTIMKADTSIASIPVIVTTQNDSESDEVTALSHGAADFVAKPYKPQIILHRVASIINLRETAAMVNLFKYDRLTGLYSKEYFYERVRECLMQNPEKEYDIICSDIENFKMINDVFGVPAGDHLLRTIADLYRKGMGDRGFCGRLNADRFGCLVEHTKDYSDEMFITALERINAHSEEKSIMMKWGVYTVKAATAPVEQMYDRALLAAQSIKGQYGKYYAVYDETLRNIWLRNQKITDSMETALAEEQFEIYLQPKYRIKDGSLAGAEALVRWNHPELGFQSPAQFIPLFEKNGFISRLDRYVWDKACALLHQWDAAGGPIPPISVNVSRADIYHADIIDYLTDTIKKYQLPPALLHLEITESAYTESPQQIIDTVGRLRKRGFVIEMDDFGSGYSSLNMLSKMPVDILKLDLKFIQTEIEAPGNEGILQFIMSLARFMKLSVVAEGVETKQQLERLEEIGCDCVQGYYFAKPMPVNDFERLMKQRRAEIKQAGAAKASKKAPDAKQTALDFCRAWFEERSLEKTRLFLAEDIQFVGTGFGEAAQGRAEMAAYLQKDIEEIPEPFQMDFSVIHEQRLTDSQWHVSAELKLKNSQYAWHVRGFFTLQDDGRWLIRNLHFAEPGSSQQGKEHYPQTLVLENAIKQRQELLNDVIAGGMMGGYLEDDFPYYFINRKMLAYLGYHGEEEFIADIDGKITNCMHPDDRAQVDAAVDRQLAAGDDYIVEYRMKKKDGSYIWVHDTGRVITAEDGRPAIISVCVDITGEKQLQEQIRRLYEKELACFAELGAAEGSHQGTFNVTQNRLETYHSATTAGMGKIGGTYDASIKSLASSSVRAADKIKIAETFDRQAILADYAAGRTDYQLEHLRRRPDGSVFWERARIRTAQNPDTGDVMAYIYSADITEQKLQESLLARISELDYDIITQIDIHRGSYHLAAFNSTWEHTIPLEGMFQKEIHQAAERCMDENARREFLQKLDFDYMKEQLEAAEAYTFVLEMQEKRGLRVKRFQVFYVSKELHCVCLTRSDVTDVVTREQRQKKELATALSAANQASAAKSDFLSRMSHEIRTPMNAIIGMNTIAAAGLAKAVGDKENIDAAQLVRQVEKALDCTSKISISSQFLLQLINDILDMSRIESGKMLLKNEKIPMEEFLNGINTICYNRAAEKNVDYECIVDAVLDDYYIGDATKLQQVLINILSNAVKFTYEGGKVTFSVTQMKKTKKDASLRFVISDTGIGMSDEFLPHVFDSFSQENTGTTSMFGGTGLGLSLSKSIVDMMSGKITVRSIKGTGTEFTVDVRLGITEEEKLRHNQKKQDLNFSHLRTLVVDDDVMVCQSAVATLLEMGVQAQWVDSGRKAVAHVKELWEQKQYYDMILIDWKMPEMDGIETARQIRGIVGPQVTIIIITAYDWLAIENEAKRAGVNLLMSKPMYKSSLVSAFTKALGGKEEPQEPEEDADYDFAGRRILLVEDNPLNTEVAKSLLESKGFLVETAEHGLRAIERFSKSEQGYYDAILMDIRMPLMDGLTAASSIRHLSNADAESIPIIAMTANAFDDDVERSKAAGMNAHLAKPIDPERLFQALYDFIIEKEAPGHAGISRGL